MASKTPGPKVVRLQLGREVREIREKAQLSRDEFADRFGWHSTKVSRIEQGHATLTSDEVERILTEFSPRSTKAAMIRKLGNEARKRGSYGKVPDWARGYIGMESDASKLRIYDSELVNGLFQTERYARAVLSTSVVVGPADIERHVRARLTRQELLTRERPIEVHIVLGEASLYREIGGREVLREQIQHLRAFAALPNVTLQVLSFAAGEHAALGTSFILLDVSEVDATYVYLEDLTSSDFWDKEPHASAYELAFSRLGMAALSERETLALLATAEQRLE